MCGLVAEGPRGELKHWRKRGGWVKRGVCLVVILILLLVLVLLLAEIVNLCMAGSSYLTMILRALASFL